MVSVCAIATEDIIIHPDSVTNTLFIIFLYDDLIQPAKVQKKRLHEYKKLILNDFIYNLPVFYTSVYNLLILY